MARLPQPGGDVGTWGAVLNDFLVEAHNTDGTLKPASVASAVPAGAIQESQLSSAVQTKLNASGTVAWADVTSKPAVIAAGADQAAARTAISAGTSNLALGATSTTALAGDTTAADIGGVTGTGITEIVAITQAAYDALVTKPATTLYVIVG